MRRTLALAAALAATGAFAVAVPTAASASSGHLYINGDQYEDAVGCINADDEWPLTVENHTDEVVAVWDDHNCTGNIIGYIPTWGADSFWFAESVSLGE